MKYKFLYEGRIEPKTTHYVDLPCNGIVKSIMVETNLPKKTMIKFVRDSCEVLLEIPVFYLKLLWFPLDIEARGYGNLRLEFTSSSKVERCFRFYVAMEEL